MRLPIALLSVAWSASVIAIPLIVIALATPSYACSVNDGRYCGQSVNRSLDANGNTVIIGGRPAGCPHRYCGCGLRKHLGLPDVRLNLAANWMRLFPRIAARPGAVAARRGHVMLLVSHVEGRRWVVRDYNSGGGLSRIHERDVRGFVFVDPSTKMAEAK